MQPGARFRERSGPPMGSAKLKLGVVDILPPGGTEWYGNYPYETDGHIYTNSVERTWDEIHPGPPFTTGGPFLNVKSELEYDSVKGSGVYYGQVYGWGTIRYTGGFANPWHPDFMSDLDYLNIGTDLSNTSYFPSLSAVGVEARQKMSPRLSSAGLSVALAEARDIPRMLQTSAKGFHDQWKSLGGNTRSHLMQPKRIADHFINHQFGWAPFLDDLSKFHDTYQNAAKYIAQTKRDNNSWVRRRRTMSKIESEQVVYDSHISGTSGYKVAPGSDLFISSLHTNSRYQAILRTKANIWSAGAFKYYRPEFDDTQPDYGSAYNAVQRQLTQYGARLNPSIIWQATPWSWLIDWFSNVGDQIKVATEIAQDGVSSKYLYVMSSMTHDLVLQQDIGLHTGGKRTLEWHRKYDIKRRVGQESPFGFNLASSSLSARQIAILGALGASGARPRRGPR